MLTRSLSWREAQPLFNLPLAPALASSESQASALRAILVNKFLLLVPGHLPTAAARLVVGLLTEADRGGLSGLALQLVQVWKERHFIQRTDAAQQAYLTRAILAALAGMRKEELEVRAPLRLGG